MKKSKYIELVLITAALASCNQPKKMTGATITQAKYMYEATALLHTQGFITMAVEVSVLLYFGIMLSGLMVITGMANTDVPVIIQEVSVPCQTLEVTDLKVR